MMAFTAPMKGVSVLIAVPSESVNIQLLSAKIEPSALYVVSLNTDFAAVFTFEGCALH